MITALPNLKLSFDKTVGEGAPQCSCAGVTINWLYSVMAPSHSFQRSLYWVG